MSTTLTKPEPHAARILDPFRMAREEFETLWSQLVGEPGERLFKGRMLPSLDLSETPTTIEVRMDVPGIKAEEIDIQLANGVLTISGERKEEKEEKGKTFHRVERRYGSFSRSVTIPSTVAEDKVDAQYHDGVLTIMLQKTEEAEEYRKSKSKRKGSRSPHRFPHSPRRLLILGGQSPWRQLTKQNCSINSVTFVIERSGSWHEHSINSQAGRAGPKQFSCTSGQFDGQGVRRCSCCD